VALKKHHKWMIGSFSTVLIIFMIISTIALLTVFTRQEINYNKLSTDVTEINSKITTLSTTTLQNQIQLGSLGTQIGDIDEQFAELKASAGDDFSGIIENVVHSVVTITTDSGQGTGFIIHDQGYIVTNAHVLADEQGRLATGVKAITYNQGTLNAEFIGYDGLLDIALLKISGTYSPLELENSDNIQIGEKVIAIGNPLGLQFSVSQGIVSALNREGINKIEAYIQTDAALNPGNSGGPLINTEGKVIGINNFKISGGESLGFSLESNYIKDTVNKISEETLNQTLI